MGDAGHPDRCPVFVYQQMYNQEARVEEIRAECEAGELGCVACKCKP